MIVKEILSKAKDFIKKIPEDKRKHFIAGFTISAFASLFVGYLLGFLFALFVGAGKEAYDHITGKGTPEFKDFLFTAFGAIASVAFSVTFTLILSAVLGLFI